MRDALEQTVAIRDVVKAKNCHEEESQTQASVPYGVGHVCLTSFNCVFDNIPLFFILVFVIVVWLFNGSKFRIFSVDEDEQGELKEHAHDIPDCDKDPCPNIADVVQEQTPGCRGQHVGGQLDGAEDGVHSGQLVGVVVGNHDNPVLLYDDVDSRGCQPRNRGQDNGKDTHYDDSIVLVALIQRVFVTNESRQNQSTEGHAGVLHNKEGLCRCEPPGPVNPVSDRGPEHDDGGRDHEAIDGGEPEVVILEVEHEHSTSEPPHVVPPGAERMGGVHPPGCLILLVVTRLLFLDEYIRLILGDENDIL